MSAPIDPAIAELLRGSALAPLIDRPVNDILRDLGLPPLPELPALPPLPELPPLPMIDLTALARPLTDMASSFGTGTLGAAAGPGPDPTQVLTGVTTALQTATTLGSTALQAVMALWQGAGAEAATGKAGQAAANGAALQTQSVQEKTVLTGAATSVGVGAGLMGAVITKYVASVAASAPFLSAPGGQAFLVAATVSAITEALAVVTKTRVELTGHSGNMAAAGQKVAITNAPTGVDSAQQIMQLLQLVTPLLTAASSGAQQLTQLAAANPALLAPKQVAKPGAEGEHGLDPAKPEGEHPGLGAGGGGGGGLGGGGVGAAAPVAAPLNAYSGTRTAAVGPVPANLAPGGGDPAAGTRPAATVGSGSPGGMMPMGAAGGAGMAGARGGGDGGDTPGFLVSAAYGDEVVGELDGASLPVVGAAEPVGADSPPDKELTL
ncbi:hypothetical protein AB0H71_12280 [Nocardia sp. NPDC050697]|uniref:hypothetical protein n=1 Tax=Nocardia sp. NPDC050697 TaxID=3155158 RepID=UPI0033E5E85D